MASLPDLLREYWSIVGPFAGTVIGALIGAAATYYSAKRQQRAQHEFEAITNLNFASGMIKAYQDVSTFMMTHKQLNMTVLESEANTRRSLLALLSAYQLIAVAVSQKILGMRLILPFTFGHARSVWTYFLPFIEVMRQSLDRPQLYYDLERFIDRYKPEHDRLLAKERAGG